ncbi:MAG TPA: hypothetical protein VGR14_03355 [Verrucomicrobiae bacterium]|jgi:hypothetical protein|nr:hypothetical protein [Verrucomicrobiae bacterium]
MNKHTTADWKMTPPQRRAFWRMWAAAMHHQGWNALPFSAQNDKRHEVLSACGFESAKDIDPTAGFDRVRARLEELADVVHVERPDAGERRRILWLINQTRTDLHRAGYSSSAVETILYMRFKVIPGANTITDLETPELAQLLFTLRARLKVHRQWQALVNIYREILTRLALFVPMCASMRLASSSNAPSTAHATPLQPTFSPNSANVKPLLFVGS